MRRRAVPSQSTTYDGRTYGGAAYYMVAGRRIGGGSRAYEYSHASEVYGVHQAILIVSSEGYGCYSCSNSSGNRTCQSCPADCTRREQCAGERATDVPFALDRYELGLEVRIPASRSSRWPLRLYVSNVTAFGIRGHMATTGADVLVSFYTEDGTLFETLTNNLSTTGWIWLIATFCLPLCISDDADKRKRLKQKQAARQSQQRMDGVVGGRHGHGPMPMDGAQPRGRSHGLAKV